MSKYLKSNHPSHSTDQAWFIFAVANPKGTGFGRLLLVEATSHAAVAFLERVVSDDGKASPTCELISVHRQCPSVGLRSKLAEEVFFRDFACEMVDRAKIERDDLAVEAFREATSARPVPAAPKEESKVDEKKYEDALAALMEFGLKRNQAILSLNPIKEKLSKMTMEDIIKQGLKVAA